METDKSFVLDEATALEMALGKLGQRFLFSRKAVLTTARDALGGLNFNIAVLENERKTLNQAVQKHVSSVADLRNDLQGKELQLRNFEAANEALKNEVNSLNTHVEELERDKTKLSEDLQGKNLRLRNFELVSEALRTEGVKNNILQTFELLVKNDFKEFCDCEPAINDVYAYQQFTSIISEMRLFANCPILHRKTIGAIGGGFSSGKSAFVNSLLSGQTSIKLAEGIRPVTAIPSYVLCDTQEYISGISYKGGSFEIPLDMYRDISHEFLRSFSFNLKEIILHTIVFAPMPEELFSNLCFIDTPGYNPSSVGSEKEDLETAKKYIKDARFLIWLVGLDSNGTIPQSDLDFLNGLEFGKDENRKLYIIASKAELKASSDIEEILDVFEECLDDKDLQYSGICAYSAHHQKVYASRGQELFDFLLENNVPNENYNKLIGFLCNALRPYVEEIHRDDAEKRKYRKDIHDLLLEGLKAGVTDVERAGNRLEEGLLALDKSFTNNESLETRLKRLQSLFEKFMGCIDEFCSELDLEKTDISVQVEALFAEAGGHEKSGVRNEKSGIGSWLARKLWSGGYEHE